MVSTLLLFYTVLINYCSEITSSYFSINIPLIGILTSKCFSILKLYLKITSKICNFKIYIYRTLPL